MPVRRIADKKLRIEISKMDPYDLDGFLALAKTLMEKPEASGDTERILLDILDRSPDHAEAKGLLRDLQTRVSVPVTD